MTNVKSGRFFTFHAYSADHKDDYTPRPIPQLAAGAKIILRFVDKGTMGLEGEVRWAGHDTGYQYLETLYKPRSSEMRGAQEFWLRFVDS